MRTANIDSTAREKPLRLWPGLVIVALQWIARFVVPMVSPELMPYGVMASLGAGAAVLAWWVFFSRAPWSERGIAVAAILIALAGTPYLLHESIATGNMGFMFPVYSVPVLSLAFFGWASLSHRLAARPRLVAMVATIFISCGVWTLVKTGGNTSDLDHDFAWRWTRTPEELLLARDEPVPARGLPSTSTTTSGQAAWPGFRGPNRDSIIHNLRIRTDWTSSPPVELWRRPIGPGWSSFAVDGDVFYTQEQRGDEEVVACYSTATGEPVWQHRDTARFWESVGGAGPRGTPTLGGGRVYTLGSTGILNVLDAASGRLVWSRDAASDTEAKLPTWGFSGSPLLVDELVIVAVSGSLAAYDLATGEPRWIGLPGGEGYSSPHLLIIDGVEQVVQLDGDGVSGFVPADGTVLWKHSWSGYPIVQPAMTADGDILVSVTAQSGTRRLSVARGADGWTVEEGWTSLGLKNYFNDFVVHNGHAFGFDGSILASIDLDDGRRKWKGGRYGGGQLVLLADQDLLLVVSERGELALVEASPDQFTELSRAPALEGKTWNHPVLVGDLLLVRNAEEMAAFRLSLEDSTASL